MAGMRVALVVVTAIVGVLASRVTADVIELKNGQRVEGSLNQADQSTITVEVGGQKVTWNVDQVKAIYFGTPAGIRVGAGNMAPGLGSVAIRALKDLQSVVKSGVTYRDYVPRVTNANIEVDRFVETPISGEENVQAALREMIGFYQVARHLWQKRVSRDPIVIVEQLNKEFPGDAEILNRCPRTQGIGHFILDIATLRPDRQAGWRDPVSDLWSCASERMEAAEKATGVPPTPIAR